MNNLASTIHDVVTDKLRQALAGNLEIRLLFHGPPLEIMSSVLRPPGQDFDGRSSTLLLPRLPHGEANPLAGASGRCDDTHLLNLRNSPSQPTFLALVPPGQHSMRSVTSTTDEFGVAASNNGGNVPFEDWWADEFHTRPCPGRHSAMRIWRPSPEGRSKGPCGTRGRGRRRARSGAHQRGNAWRVLSRLFEAATSNVELAPGQGSAWPAACLHWMTEVLQRANNLRCSRNSPTRWPTGLARGSGGQGKAQPEDQEHLDAFLVHLRGVCDLPTAFERATATYYAPGNGVPAARGIRLVARADCREME